MKNLITLNFAILCVGLAMGYLSCKFINHDSVELSNAEFSVADYTCKPQGEFCPYGKFKVRGTVIKVHKEERPWEGFTTYIIVPFSKNRKPNNYEVHYDHGIYLVHVRGKIIKFSAVHLKTSDLMTDINTGDALTISGEYGEYSNPSGSTTSLPGVSLFVVKPSLITIHG